MSPNLEPSQGNLIWRGEGGQREREKVGGRAGRRNRDTY
jgi:hypothetical protein